MGGGSRRCGGRPAESWPTACSSSGARRGRSRARRPASGSTRSSPLLGLPRLPGARDHCGYRTFVAQPHRYSNLAAQLIFRTRDLIEGRHVSGEDARADGILFELENPGMRSYFNRALWLPANFLFINENEHGAHVRVHYFPDAQAPVPG